MNIYEYPMDYIDVDNIEILAAKPKNIRFTDGKNEYGFSLAKSTLYERFILREPLDSVEVKIAEDPFEILKSIKVDDMLIGNSNHHEHIYLPLYSGLILTLKHRPQNGAVFESLVIVATIPA